MAIQSFGPFRLNSAERLLERDGAPITIGGRTLDLLIALIQRAGDVVGGRELMDLVWPNVTVEEANLRVAVSTLRKILGDGIGGARYILNVAGRGYMFVATLRTEDLAGSAGVGRSPGYLMARSSPDMPKLLIGRDDTRKALSQLLMSQRFASVVGPGGIGKTTVALAVANQLRPEFGDDRVCFVDGGAVSDPDDLPNAVASVLGCRAQVCDVVWEISVALAGKRTLLILDSCEHIVEAAAALSEHLFLTADGVHLLITSREALRVQGENVLLLQPLQYPLVENPTALEAMATPAVQLFMERAATSGHLISLSDEDAPIVSHICRRLDGVALAIELVASRVGVYGIHGTIDLLDSGAQLMLQGRRNALPRHQTLQALLDWSYCLLAPQEQKVFARLSVFAGELPLAAACAVVGDAGDDRKAISQAIASLGDKSLIQVSTRSGQAKYRLLDTTRAYAAHKLAERGEVDEMARRHSRYLTSLALSDVSDEPPSDLDFGGTIVRRRLPAGDMSIGVR